MTAIEYCHIRLLRSNLTATIKNVNAPIFLVGATATGKSTVAMELARRLNAAILCMDAMQVYRGADVGTSKPTRADQLEVPHGGLDLVDFGASFDVAQYLKHAAEFLQKQSAVRRRVIVVGGTGLYFRALTQGLCEAPQGEEELRAELNALSTEQLAARLRSVDPGMIEQLDASNPRRLIRAIEVMESTGRSLRAWQAETPEPLVKQFHAFWLNREKEELNARIETRVEEMFAQGWVNEVRGLVEKFGTEKVINFAGIGYRDIAESTDPPGDKLKSNIHVATRQYAKRQLTWFAREITLEKAMLSGAQPLPAALLSLS